MTCSPYVGKELDLFARAVRWKAYWSSHVRPLLAGNVLEVGAGIGANTPFLLSSRVSRWVSIEPDRGLAERLRARRDALREPRWQVACGCIDCIEPRGAFDAVVYVDVLEHIPDDRRELAEAALRLGPDGLLIILAPAFGFLFSTFDSAIGHHRRYSRKSLLNILPEGLATSFLGYLDSLGLLLSLGNKALLRRRLPTHRQIETWDRLIIPLSVRTDRLANFRVGRALLGVWRKRA